jgi:hypothetical protein
LKENSQKLFESHYSRNKFITENLINKIIKNKFLILRLPNLLYFKKVKKKALIFGITGQDGSYLANF